MFKLERRLSTLLLKSNKTMGAQRKAFDIKNITGLSQTV